MWLPTPIYERIPQLWFLMGLLIIVLALYIGLDSKAMFFAVGLGAGSCIGGICTHLIRLRHRGTKEPGEEKEVPLDETGATTV